MRTRRDQTFFYVLFFVAIWGATSFLNAASIRAQEANADSSAPVPASETAAPSDASASAPTSPAESETAASSDASAPAESSSVAPDVFLALEKTAREKSPELFEKLIVVREFSKRLPNFWRLTKPTKKQTNAIYAIQKEYFEEISKLEARIARLEKERDARMRAVLSDEQRKTLDVKLAEEEKERAEKAAAKKAAEDAEE